MAAEQEDSENFHKFNQSLRRYKQARNRYRDCYTKWRDNRKANITNIRLLMKSLEPAKHKTNITDVISAFAGAAGGVLMAVGVVALPFTCTSPFSYICMVLEI